jgi:REase_MTES_1575/AAA domain
LEAVSTTSPPPPADPGPTAEAAPGATAAGTVAPEEVTPEDAALPQEPSLGTPETWREVLVATGLPDTLLAVGDPGDQALDLTHAHPSGLATLLAGRPTPLSMLFREAAVHSAARRRSRSLRGVATELAADRGVRAGLLTAGVAGWTAPWDPDERVHAPVLLRGCDVRPRGAGHDDYELELDDTAVVNPELLRRLREDHGVRLDGEALAELAFGIHGFDPDPVFRVFEDACAGVGGFAVEPRVLVGCFTAGSDALVADLDAALPALAGHPLLGRLADPLLAVVPPRPPVASAHPTSPAVLDLDVEQRSVVAAVLAGEDVAVEGPPGTGLTHTLAACVAGLAEQGRRVLVLTPYRGSADALTERLDAAGLGDLVLSLHDGTGDRPRLLAALGSALDAAVSDRPPEAPTALFTQVEDGPGAAAADDDDDEADAAEELDAALTALHAVRGPWHVSAYDAMVELAALMAAPAPPRTRVRLAYDVCRRLDAATREELRTVLREAAELGAFTLTPEQTPWLDAHVATEAEARRALGAARSGRESLEVARQSMARIAAAAGLVEAASVEGWHRQLDLLVGVRDTLDVLLPTVFEQPLGELIAATAPDGGPPGASFLARRALRRRARSLVRPGVHLPDLHVRLLMAQRQLAGWQARSSGGGWPRVPTGLAVAEQALDALEHALDVLGVALPRTGPEELRGLPLEVLDDRLAALAADADGAQDAPRRAQLLARFRDAGLGDLVDDLRGRAAGPDALEGELDLAWWTSVLEAIIRSDARLARHEADTLTGLVDRLREQHTRSTAAARRRVRLAVEERARQVAAEHPQQARWLLSEVHRGHRSRWPNDLVRHAPDLLAALRPVWVLSPDAAARLLPPAASGRVVDTVVVDDAGQVGFPAAAAALARGRHVIVAGDRRRLPPATGGPSVLEVVASLTGVRTLHRDHRCRDGRLLAPLLDRYQGWTSTPGAAARSPLVVEHVREGTGVAAPGEEVAVSPDAEVLRIVDLVTEHAVRRPGESLLVVTLGMRHAARIEEALRAEVAHNPDLARWLDVHWTGGISEPFLVRPVHRLAGLERDAVILSIGLARTPHGRVLHRFGVLDGRHGVACLVAALSRARRRTTVVCAFRAEDISAERVRSEGARLLRDVLEVATDPGARGDHDARLALAEPARPDHLVADLARRLREAGLPVAASLPAPDRPLDLAVSDVADPGRMLLAVDVDVPAHAALSPPDVRERQRRATFERSGWRYLRVAAMDLFCDPDREVTRIRQAWRAAGGTPATLPPVSAPGVPQQPRNRAPWPDVTPGRTIGAYGERELDAVARWVLSDGVPRTPEALAADLRDALQIGRQGERADAGIAAAARRVLGVETLVS